MVIGLLPKLEPLCHCPGCGRRWGFVLSPSRLPRVSWCQHPQFVSPAVFLAKVSRRRPASVCIRTLLIHFSDEDPMPLTPHHHPSRVNPSLESNQTSDCPSPRNPATKSPCPGPSGPLFTLNPLDLHPIDITIRVIAQRSLIRASHARSTASLRLSGASRASEPAPSDPGHPRISVPALPPSPLPLSARHPGCRPGRAAPLPAPDRP